MLKPADAPPKDRRKNQSAIDEIVKDGVVGQWYVVAEYDVSATARDAAAKLRKRNPEVEIRSQSGVVFARRMK